MNGIEQLGEERRLIFVNVANGVPIQQVMSAFRKSEKEVMDDVRFIGRKIAEYRFRGRLPPLSCSTLHDISWHRRALLETLERLSDRFLGSQLTLPNIHVEKLDHPSITREVAARTGARLSV
jgi:hypothetical protein